MNIKYILKNLLIILVLTLCLSACGDKANDVVNETDTISQSIEARTAIIFQFLNGEGVFVTRNNEKEEAYEGMRLNAEDIISTDDVSSVYLRIDDDKNILLNTNSSVIIEELKTGKLNIRLETGEFFFNVENKLADDETMEFSIGSTSLSIRGTSGTGKVANNKDAAFSIYTGKGEISDDFNNDVAYTLLPNTIVKFDIESETKSEYQEATLSTISENDISELVQDYADTNEDYKEELSDGGWVADEKGDIIPDKQAIEEIISKSDLYKGYVQNKDGTWTHSKENEEKGIEPVKYVEPVKQVVKQEEVKYEEVKQEVVYVDPYTYIDKPIILDNIDQFEFDGNLKTAVTGFNDKTMTLVGNISATNADSYEFEISPKSGFKWKDGTVDIIYGKWSIDPKIISKPSISRSISNKDDVSYSGNEISLFDNFDSDSMILDSGNIVATNQGYYEYQISLNSNYIWDDSTTDPISGNWTIIRYVDKPQINGNLIGNNTYELSYTGETLSFVNNYIEGPMYYTGTMQATNLGSYTLVIYLNDYCKWSDKTVDAIGYTFNIIVEIDEPYIDLEL